MSETETPDRGIAWQALNEARAADAKIEAHEELCAERYGNINASIAEIKSFLRWAGGAGFTIIVGLLGWSLVQQFDAADTTRREAADQIHNLQQQVQQGRAQPPTQ